MNALATYIQTAGLTGTAAEIATALDAEVAAKEDHTRYSYAGLAKLFGYEVIGQIDETLRKVPGMDWVRLSLSGPGIDFADAETQKGLDALEAAGALSKEIVTTLKALGIVKGPLWQQAGFEKLPSEAEIEIALQVNRVRQLGTDIHSVFDQVDSAGDVAEWLLTKALAAALAVRDDGADLAAVRKMFAEE